MPAESERQRRFMGAELGRAERGEKTQTGMTKNQLKDFARKPVRGKSRSKRSGRK